MTTAVRRFEWLRALIVAAGLALMAAGTCRAEVGAVWSAGQPSLRMSAYKLMAIGDDPEPIPPMIWHQYSPIGSNRVVLNPEGEANGDGAPSMVSDPASGLLVVAWARNSATGFDVVISKFVDGAWTTPAIVVDSAPNVLDPQLVLDGAGNVHLFYWQDGVTPQVFHQQAPWDLSAWSAPLLASQAGQAACRPAGAVYQGVLHVAYEVHDFGFGNTPRQVVLAKLQNGEFVPEVVAITNNLGDVRPEVHAQSGHMWIEWIDTETTGGSGEVAWTRLDAQGHWEPLHYRSFANAEQRDFLVRGSVKLQAIE